MERKDQRYSKIAFIAVCALAWGMFAHGMALFNKYSCHDDLMWPVGFYDNDTYGLGRWARGLLGSLFRFLFGSKLYSTPAVHGFITIACLALILYIVVLQLKVENRFVIVALSGAMIAFPCITALFGFMFVAPYYYIGAALGVVGAYLYYREPGIKTFIVCTVFMAFSTAVYQSNIPIHMMVLLLFVMGRVCESDMKWKEFFILALKNAGICAAFMAEYLVLNKVFLSVKGLGLAEYKGISNFGMTSPSDYVLRIYSAYKRFLRPADFIGTQGVSANMFPWSLKYWHLILVAVTLVLLFLYIRSFESKRKMIQLSLIVLISPLFAYFIYVMVGEPEVHALMTYGEVFLFFIPAYLIEKLSARTVPVNILRRVAIALMLIIAFVFARYANVCYLKADIMQSEAVSYFNRLAIRIQSAEGYTADTPVMYVGESEKKEEGFSCDERFDEIWIAPYEGNSLINDYAWEETMNMWCGFTPVKASEEEMAAVDEAVISQMPCYPDEGSIKKAGDVLVVKFSDGN